MSTFNDLMGTLSRMQQPEEMVTRVEATPESSESPPGLNTTVKGRVSHHDTQSRTTKYELMSREKSLSHEAQQHWQVQRIKGSIRE
eukprot:4016856-Amphidinium_carterae.1